VYSLFCQKKRPFSHKNRRDWALNIPFFNILGLFAQQLWENKKPLEILNSLKLNNII
jgi:hypothetical protein